MQIISQNIFTNFTKSNIIKTFVLIVFLTHILLAHVVAQSYYLCIESDGKIVLESVSEKDNCCSPTESEVANDDIETCSFCEDVSISEDCDDYYSITKNNLKLVQVSDLCISINYYSLDQFKINFTTIKQNSGSPHLDSHKTVLLLI